MSGLKTEKKVITSTYNVDTKKHPSVNFEVDRFDASIINKGYNVYHHRSLRCPCMNRETNSPLPDCDNCSGLGWFYVEKKKTKALMQSMGNSKKFETWSETNAGTVKVSSLFQDDVTYMDKFEIIDLEANFSQTLLIQKYQNKIFAFTIYEPIQIMNIYKFEGSKMPLKLLYSKDENPTNWDYYVDKNKIVFNENKYTWEELSVSVRYKHVPVYCIIDIQREIFKTKDKECSELCDENDLSIRGMPQLSIAKRLHYLWNSRMFDSKPREFDNTDYEKEGNKNIETNDNTLF